MAHESTTLRGCLSRIFVKSPPKAVPAAGSTIVSTYVRSWTALCIGAALGCVTFFVLFEDVLRGGAKVTTDHVLTLAVLMIVAAAGHKWFGEFRNRHVFSAAGLIVVFVAGAVYLVVASGGRNAEVMIAKRLAAEQADIERERIGPLLEQAEKMLTTSRAQMQAECASGRGTRCAGREATVSVYEAAVLGHKAELERLGPPVDSNGALKSTARVIVAWYGVAEEERADDEARYVERLELLIPYIKALLVELATVVFVGAGLGHRRMAALQFQPATIPETVPVARAATVAPTKYATVTQLRPAATVSNVEALAMQLLRRSLTVPQAEVVRLFGGNKSRASRFLARLESEGVVSRVGVGREKLVTLTAARREAGHGR